MTLTQIRAEGQFHLLPLLRSFLLVSFFYEICLGLILSAGWQLRRSPNWLLFELYELETIFRIGS